MATILLIEDSQDNRNVTELILTDAGYTVLTAGDGLRGLDLATHGQPDLIVMDLALPRLDGWSATRRLKAQPATRHIPVVAFTAHVTPEAIARAELAGCVAVITKPFEIETLLDTIVRVLAQAAPGRRQRAVGTDREA
jgi:two-component system, cell cycle response regulator DivK